jgi:hypothetical protein
MVSTKWTLLTPILVALIPVLAGILLVKAPTIEKPVVAIEKLVLGSSPKVAFITIKNTGGAPATNIKVYVQSKESILIVEQSSLANINRIQELIHA